MNDAADGRAEYVHHVWPARPVHLAAVRAEVRRWLAPLGLGEATEDDLVLAVSEAASNAAEHAYLPATAGDTVELSCWVEARAVCIEIVDHGTWQPPAPVPGIRGRGLRIMSRLVESMQVRHDGHDTRVLLRHPAEGFHDGAERAATGSPTGRGTVTARG